MAFEWTMKQAKDRIRGAVETYADSRGWPSEAYRLFLRFNDRVGRIHVFLVGPDFPGLDAEEKWLRVRKFLNERLTEEVGLADSISLTLRTFEEFDQGGIYTPGPSFTEVVPS